MIKIITAASVFFILVAVVILVAWPEMEVTLPDTSPDAALEDEKEKDEAQDVTGIYAPSGVHAQRIPPEEAKILMESVNPIILDVRNPDEYAQGHIKGALLIPLDELEARAPKELSDKWRMILIYCRSGNRSATAAKLLSDMNYMNIFDFGGINDWPYETVK